MSNKNIMRAQEIKLEKLIKSDNVFKIPFFQRSYVWEEEHWERFLDDAQTVSGEESNYFMGAMILKSSDDLHADVLSTERLVIDGQQRLTTILIFLKVAGWDEEGEYLFRERGGSILYHNHNDKEVFDEVMKGNLSDSFKENHGDSRVLKCYQYFEENSEKVKEVNVDTILRHMIFICISLSHEDDEQQVFDTMNSLGVSLQTGELLKNELYREGERDLYEKTWRQAFERDKDQRKFWDTKFGIGQHHKSHMDLLLQAYLLIKSDNYASGKYKRIDMLFNNYKIALKREFKASRKPFIDDLMRHAKEYEANISAEHDKKELKELKKSVLTHRLNIITFGAGITPVIPYIVYILGDVEDRNEQKKIFDLLENYLMRRAIVGDGTKNYNKYFNGLIRNKKNTYQSLHESFYKSDSDTQHMPSDEELRRAIANRELPSAASKVAKIILYFLECSLHDEHSATQPLSVSQYNIEHVMPRKWQANWEDKQNPLSSEEREEREKLIYTLGNLTILTPKLNSGIGNLSWIDKRDGPLTKNGQRKRGLKNCCAGLKTFSDYFDRDDWNEEVIKERSEYLFGLAKKLWPYEPPTS